MQEPGAEGALVVDTGRSSSPGLFFLSRFTLFT